MVAGLLVQHLEFRFALYVFATHFNHATRPKRQCSSPAVPPGIGAPRRVSPALVWSIAAGTIAGILFRPKDWPEAVWACLGAILLVASGLLPLSQAGAAVAKGTDVYLFLTGMMLLSELARQEGVFDWLASLAVG